MWPLRALLGADKFRTRSRGWKPKPGKIKQEGRPMVWISRILKVAQLNKRYDKSFGTWESLCQFWMFLWKKQIISAMDKLHSTIESLDKQAGPSQWLSLASCKRLSPRSPPAAGVLFLHVPSALQSSGLMPMLRPNLGLQSGLHEEEQGAGWGRRSVTAPESHSSDRNCGKAIATNYGFFQTLPFSPPVMSLLSKQHHSSMARRGSVQRRCDGTSSLLGPGLRPTKTKRRV